MIESHLVGGRQDLNDNGNLTYGQSITDACLAWEDSVPLLRPWRPQYANAARCLKKTTPGSLPPSRIDQRRRSGRGTRVASPRPLPAGRGAGERGNGHG